MASSAPSAGVTVGAVWLDVLPSMRNFGSDLVDTVDESTREAGETAGENIGEGAEEGFKGRVSALAAVGATAGLAVGAALASAVSQAMDIEAGQAKLAAQLGLTADESQRYGRIAGEVYSNAYGESLDQVNEAISSVHRNIGDNLNDADLSAITGTVLNLADTFDADLGGATAAVGQLMKTGLAPDAKSALDVITAGFQHGIDMSGDFLDVITEYGVQFQKLGLDGAAATGLLSQGLDAGARSADLVADALKEFSIRAVDGSETTAAGFKALGIDAKQMAAQIAQGGPAASAGLDTILDRLRAMKDPVAQSQAAVALFGTQAEDLGAALYALDPSSAVDALGQVGGAADSMNTALGETASARLESFQRTVMTTFVNVVGGYALPIIEQVANVVGVVLGPALTILGGILTGVIVPALSGFVGWIKDSAGWLVPVAVGVGAFVLALNAATIATTLWGLATSAANTVMALARGAVLAFQMGVWLLNAAMAANPIGIVVALLVGLVAALVVAYNSSETFRGIVTGAFDAVMVAVRWLGDAAVWLWTSVLSPVFSAIGTAARVVAAVVLTILITPLVLAFQLLAAVVTWWWTTIVEPVWQAVAAGATWLWTTVLAPVWAAMQAGLALLGAAFSWLYTNAVQPAFTFIGTVATWLYQNVFVPWWSGIKLEIAAVGAVFSWLYANAIKPALDGVGAAVSFVWNSILRPTFDAISGAARAVGDSFGWAVDRIRETWGRIQDITRPPIAFVVNVVYNSGIRPTWNFIADLFGLGQLPAMTFAEGGMVPGYAPRQDIVPAWLSPGEGVLVPEAVRMIGGGPAVLALNSMARGGVQKFADGGIVGAVGNAVGSIVDFITDPVQATKDAFKKALDLTGLGGVGRLSDALLAMPGKAIDGAVAMVKDAVAKLFPSGLGATATGNLGQWIATAMAITGVPASWAGPLNTLIMRESGGNPNAINLWDINAQRGYPSQGLMQTIPQTFAAYRDPRLPNVITDPVANIVAGINYIKSRYGSIFNVQQAVGSTPRGYDSGGYLPPGWSTVYNGTGRPEPVLTGDQWDAISAGTQGGDGGEFEITSGWLEVREDGLVRFVDGRLRRVGTSISNGRRA